MMSKPFATPAFLFAAFTATTVGAPVTASFADSMSSPNAINNAMVDERMTHAPSTGFYDGADQYRNVQGFPQSGWQYLALPPS